MWENQFSKSSIAPVLPDIINDNTNLLLLLDETKIYLVTSNSITVTVPRTNLFRHSWPLNLASRHRNTERTIVIEDRVTRTVTFSNVIAAKSWSSAERLTRVTQEINRSGWLISPWVYYCGKVRIGNWFIRKEKKRSLRSTWDLCCNDNNYYLRWKQKTSPQHFFSL